MARLKGWKGSGKSVTLKSATVTYVSRGALVASSWPKKRGRPKSSITREQNEWFRQANLLAKYADGQAQWMAIELSRDSPWYPRDILISAMAGRLFETLNLDGVEFRSVAIRDDVSSDLDFLAGKIPGTIMVRGLDLWDALVPGAPGDVLTSNGPATLPSYAPGAGAASLTHASKIPLLTFDSESFATKGIVFMPQTAFGVHAIGTRINATVNHVYRGVIFQIGANFVISAIVAETADITAPSTAHLQLHEAFPAPVTLSANVPYAICWTRRDGSNTFKLPLSKANTSLPMIGIPERFFIPVNGIAPRIRIAQANPQVGQTLVPVTTSGPFINATVSV